jgi:hypothetical protein
MGQPVKISPMKFSIPITCSTCGTVLPVTGYGEKSFPAAFCPTCRAAIFCIDPLSISIVADRLLYRSRAEIDCNDPTVSIICSAIAVETALTQVSMKWKEIDRKIGKPTPEQREELEKEYRNGTKRDKSKRSEFEKSADLVSKYLTDKLFDDFVSGFVKKNGTAALIGAESPRRENELKASYIYKKLFDKRNRIMHWGEVGFEKDDALSAFTAACDAISILKFMDQERCETMRRSFRA